MSSAHLKHFSVAFFALSALAILPQACGGGGGGNGSPPKTQPGQIGSQTPAPDGTGAPTATSTPEVVRAGASIAASIKRAPAGSTIIVSAGQYAPVVLTGASTADSITLLADPTGMLAGGTRGAVTITASPRDAAAISVSGVSNLTIDGFTITGGTKAGVLAVDSPGTWVQDCVIKRSAGAGVQYTDSDDGLVFNDLIWDNAGAGIAVLGSNNTEIFNNTIYKNTGGGMFIGEDTASVPVPSSGAQAENNIVNKNTPSGISVSAASDFGGEFNFNTDGYDGTSMGPDDVDSTVFRDPLFFAAGRDDNGFYLQVGLVGSTSPAIDAGDPSTPVDLVAALEERTTQLDGTLDADAPKRPELPRQLCGLRHQRRPNRGVLEFGRRRHRGQVLRQLRHQSPENRMLERAHGHDAARRRPERDPDRQEMSTARRGTDGAPGVTRGARRPVAAAG